MSKCSTTPKRETRRIAGQELRIVRDSSGAAKLTGYAVVYNSRSVNLGGFVEIVSSTAFTRTLRESPDVYALYSHVSPFVIGRTKSGTLALNSDERGLRFECTPPDTTVANDMVKLIERGDVDGCSFGFMVREDSWETPAGNEPYIRTLLDVDLDEISITPFPAYTDTSVSLRSAPREIRMKLSKRDDTGDDECTCDCDSCLAGDCDECSNPDCDDVNCGDCAATRAAGRSQSEATREGMRMQLQLAEVRSRR